MTPGLTARTRGVDQTRALAAAIARLCTSGDVLLLAGDLGAGKTAFAQGFGGGLGVAEPITSPTFTLVRQYAVPEGSSVGTLLHADVYRLDHLHEIVDLGLGQLVEDGAVALVEWGDSAEPILGRGALVVAIAPGDEDDDRVITLEASGGGWGDRWVRLGEAVAPWGAGT